MFSCAKPPAGQFSFVTVYLSRDLCELSLANAVDVWFHVFSLQVKAIHVHDELFSVENGFLTPTFKTKRAIVAKAFEEKFQELYEEVDKRLEFRRLTSFEIQQVVWMEQWSFCMHACMQANVITSTNTNWQNTSHKLFRIVDPWSSWLRRENCVYRFNSA